MVVELDAQDLKAGMRCACTKECPFVAKRVVVQGECVFVTWEWTAKNRSSLLTYRRTTPLSVDVQDWSELSITF